MPTPARRESAVPVDLLPEVPADQRRDERAEVDAHVEDREAGVAARVAWRVELADDGADVRLQQAGADDDQQQAQRRRSRASGRHRDEVPERDHDAAEEHRAPLAEEPVGDPAAREAIR